MYVVKHVVRDNEYRIIYRKNGILMKFIVRNALPEDLDSIVKMRLKLQKHIEQSNQNLWKMSDKLINQLLNDYKSCIDNPEAQLLVAVCMKTHRLAGMGLGKILHHDIFIPTV